MKKNNLRSFLTMLLIILITMSFVLHTKSTKAQTSTISSDLALDLALSYSKDNGLDGWLTPPEKSYGQVMTYKEAIRFVSGKPIDPNTKEYKKQNKIIWLIVLEGEFIEHVPPSVGGNIPAKEVAHNQMVIILDGNTGDIMRQVLVSPKRKLHVTNLPVLQKTDKELPALPTRGSISTEIPYPTLSPESITAPEETPTPTKTPTPEPQPQPNGYLWFGGWANYWFDSSVPANFQGDVAASADTWTDVASSSFAWYPSTTDGVVIFYGYIDGDPSFAPSLGCGNLFTNGPIYPPALGTLWPNSQYTLDKCIAR